MAHNSRIRAPGFWVLGSVVDPAEFEALDAAQYAAIHDGGGTWSPSPQIIVGGASGVKFNCPVEGTWTPGTIIDVAGAGIGVSTYASIGIDATLDVSGILNIRQGGANAAHILSGAELNVNSGGKIEWEGTGLANFTGTSGCLFASGCGSTYLSGSSFLMNSGSTMTVAGGATLSGTTTLSGTKTLSGATTISGTLALSATTTRTGSETKSGSSATTFDRVGTTTDSDSSYDISKDVYYVPLLSADRNYTLKHTTGPTIAEGARVRFVADVLIGGNGVTFLREDATTIWTNAATVGSSIWWAEFVYCNVHGSLQWEWGGAG